MRTFVGVLAAVVSALVSVGCAAGGYSVRQSDPSVAIAPDATVYVLVGAASAHETSGDETAKSGLAELADPATARDMDAAHRLEAALEREADARFQFDAARELPAGAFGLRVRERQRIEDGRVVHLRHAVEIVRDGATVDALDVGVSCYAGEHEAQDVADTIAHRVVAHLASR